jgi:putative Ca2+/H+ antiporter (TMEM165/GDT1 family)
MEAFWLSLGLIFLAELGDKTQLVAMTLAARFRAGVVLWGVFVATLAVHAFSVLLGDISGRLLGPGWIETISGLAFIFFGLWTLRGDSLDEEKEKKRRSRSPFMIVAVTFFLAELGDKTMLGTVTLAAGQPWLPVWLGSTIGMVASDGLAILVGQIMGKRLPERAISRGAAVVFFLVGLVYLWQGVSALRG